MKNTKNMEDKMEDKMKNDNQVAKDLLFDHGDEGMAAILGVDTNAPTENITKVCIGVDMKSVKDATEKVMSKLRKTHYYQVFKQERIDPVAVSGLIAKTIMISHGIHNGFFHLVRCLIVDDLKS